MSLDLGQELACMMREVVQSLKSVEALYHVPYLGRQVTAVSKPGRNAGGQGSCRHSKSAPTTSPSLIACCAESLSCGVTLSSHRSSRSLVCLSVKLGYRPSSSELAPSVASVCQLP